MLILLLVSFTGNIKSQSSIIERSGDLLFVGLPVLAFGVTFLENSNFEGSRQAMLSIGTAGMATNFLKRVINDPRPNGERFGFPSGHSAMAFTGAAFIQHRYGWAYGIPAYLLASYVGFTRIYANKHDLWDVMGGAAIGIISVNCFTTRYKDTKIKLNITGNGQSNLLNLSMVF
jgi:membrane-associated phospholipid phosphatase